MFAIKSSHTKHDMRKYRVGLSISRKVLQIMFWEVPTADWLICSYLLPRQSLTTHVEKHNKTLRLIDSPALYFTVSFPYPFRLLDSTHQTRRWKTLFNFQNRPMASSWISHSTGTTAFCTCSPISLCCTFSFKSKG